MKSLAVVLCLVVLSQALTAHNQWLQFKKDHSKIYLNSAEESYRYKVFLSNLVKAAERSVEDVHAEHGVTRFMDLTEEEFQRMYLMPAMPADTLARSCLQKGVISPRIVKDTPPKVDWRTVNPPVVTPVKDQGQCGSCWTFSVTGAMEGAWALAGHSLVSLSEQEIVDCSKACCEVPPYGPVCNEGCNGGWQWSAMFDIMTPAWGGLMSEAAYPYKAVDGTCKKDPKQAVASIANYTCLGPDEAKDMLPWVAEKGPLAIALDATPFQTYKNGILNPKSCQQKQLNHAVLIVGYDVSDKTNPYWIIKNSWGTSWGEAGYVRMIYGKCACGLCNANNAPLITQ